MSHPEVSLIVLEAFLSAYRSYTQGRLVARGWSVDESILGEGEAWLAERLGEELARPLLDQRRGPLEIFQEALKFPTEALAAQGIEPVARDEVTVQVLPGDLYDLAPASSRDLGEAAWMAHLAWGAAKAQAFLDAQA